MERTGYSAPLAHGNVPQARMHVFMRAGKAGRTGRSIANELRSRSSADYFGLAVGVSRTDFGVSSASRSKVLHLLTASWRLYASSMARSRRYSASGSTPWRGAPESDGGARCARPHA